MHDAITVDLSQLGTRVRADIVLLPGQAIEVIPTGGPRHVVPSCVVWVGATGSDQDREAGLKFLQPLPAAA